jgi:hypothetical protein
MVIEPIRFMNETFGGKNLVSWNSKEESWYFGNIKIISGGMVYYSSHRSFYFENLTCNSSHLLINSFIF